MNTAIEFTGVFIKTENGVMAYLQDLPEVAVEGDNKEEAAKKLMELLPEVWKIKKEIEKEQQIISGNDEETFTTQNFTFIPAQ